MGLFEVHESMTEQRQDAIQYFNSFLLLVLVLHSYKVL
jgi:hypothetical protein